MCRDEDVPQPPTGAGCACTRSSGERFELKQLTIARALAEQYIMRKKDLGVMLAFTSFDDMPPRLAERFELDATAVLDAWSPPADITKVTVGFGPWVEVPAGSAPDILPGKMFQMRYRGETEFDDIVYIAPKTISSEIWPHPGNDYRLVYGAIE